MEGIKIFSKELQGLLNVLPNMELKILDENGNAHKVKSIFYTTDHSEIYVSAIPMRTHKDLIDGTWTVWDESFK